MMIPKVHLVLFIVLAGCMTSCGFYELDHGDLHGSPASTQNTEPRPKTVDTGDTHGLDEITQGLAHKRVLFLGEVHDRIEHHHNQLRILKALYSKYPDLAIGVEYFQQPFQPYLDDYIAGRIDEREMLVKTEYFKRWKVDFRLIEPIFEFARDNHIPIIALNVPDEIHNKVFMSGMQSLTPAELAQTPEGMEPASESYLQRLKSIYNSHPTNNGFGNFVEGVLLWDESMADTAARYLKAHPGSRMVVLTGLVHVMYGDGIPERVDRRLGSQQSVVAINGNDFGNYPGIADFQLRTKDSHDLPKTGKLGIFIAEDSHGVRISDFTIASAARSSGLSSGDMIVALDDIKVANAQDMKSVMFDKLPGDKIKVSVLREGSVDPAKLMKFDVVLH